MKRVLLTMLIGALALSGCAEKPKTVEYFSNPVIHGDVADPTMIRIDDTYYAAGTSSEWAPHYPVFESKDLVNWTQTGHIFNKKPEWTSNSFWAPELYLNKTNGRVYCYYTARRASDRVSYVGVASAAHPTDEFTDHGLLIEWGTEAIDSFVFEDDGQLYISWKAYGLDDRPIEILGSKLSADGLKLEGEPFMMLRDDERIGMEGQYHFKKGDWWYIVYSPRGCCGPRSDYEVWVARSKDVTGPYEKYAGNPILRADGTDFMSLGHGTIAETPDGRLFYLCHAYMPDDGFFCGRQPVLHEMEISEDEWVRAVNGNIAHIQQPMPFEGTVQKPIEDFVDDFQADKLRVDWTWNYVAADVTTEVGGGKLLLGGAPFEGVQNGVALCVRPTSSEYSFETQVVTSGEGFKGLAMYGDDRNLMSWGCIDGKLIVRTVDNREENIIKEIPFDGETVYLKTEVTQGYLCTFFYSTDGKEWTQPEGAVVNGNNFVRWDRIARPGIVYAGTSGTSGEFRSFKLANKEASAL